MTEKVTGNCLCEAVSFVVEGKLADGHICHCSQCRRQSGHAVAATEAPRDAFKLTASSTLQWFESSPGVRRGFCGTCGSAMFWDNGEGGIGINAGCLNAPTGMKMTSHIFVADKGDYYDISDDLPKHEGYG